MLLGNGARNVSDCHNGRLIVFVMPDNGMPGEETLFCPLHPGKGTAVIQFPQISAHPHDGVSHYSTEFLFHDGGAGVSAVTVMRSERQALVHIRDLQAGGWGEGRYSDLIQLPATWHRCEKFALLANGKLYLICMARYILAIDVASMSSTCIRLPDRVECGYFANLALSRAEGSGFCLAHVRGLQMQLWRYSMDCRNIGNWRLIDTINLYQVFGRLADPSWASSGAIVRVHAVGDNAEFVFLRIQNKVLYLDISSRKVKKVYELRRDESVFDVSPFMMVWPPTFPVLKGGHNKDE